MNVIMNSYGWILYHFITFWLTRSMPENVLSVKDHLKSTKVVYMATSDIP